MCYAGGRLRRPRPCASQGGLGLVRCDFARWKQPQPDVPAYESAFETRDCMTSGNQFITSFEPRAVRRFRTRLSSLLHDALAAVSRKRFMPFFAAFQIFYFFNFFIPQMRLTLPQLRPSINLRWRDQSVSMGIAGVPHRPFKKPVQRKISKHIASAFELRMKKT